jgi:ABC-type nitrate/sulfonate/bicarbonate transport system substrate-binding protein
MQADQPLPTNRRRRGPRGPRLGWCLLALGLAAASCTSNSAPPASTSSGAGPSDRSVPTPAVSSPPAEALPPLAQKLVLNFSTRGNGQAGMWLVHEGGFLRELGVDEELINVPATSRIIAAMVTGEVNLSSMDPGASILASVEGIDMVLLAAGGNRPSLSVVTQASIDEPAKMRGKSLGITRLGTSTHTAALLALKMWGLEPDQDVPLRQLEQPEAIWAAMEAKQLDAGMMGVSTKIFALRAGYRELINLATAGPEYPQVTVNGLRPWVNANEEAVRRFARAYTQARQRLRTDKPWAMGVMQKYLDTDDQETLEAFYDEVVACCGPVPYITEEGTGRLLADLARNEPRLAGRQPSEWIEPKYLREVEAAGYPR